MAAPARGQRRNRPQGQQQGQQGQPRQQLSMNDALATLQSMFGSVDRSVIQMVLVEGCSGNMEQAVEALLKITESQSSSNNNSSNSNNAAQPAPAAPAAFGLPQPNEDAVTRATKSKRSSQSGRIDKKKGKEQMQNQLAQRAQSHRQGHAQQQQQQQQRRPVRNQRVNLPDDFLRPPSYYLEKYPKDRRSLEEINSNNRNSDPNFDQKAEREKQIIEDEIFAKAIFEDALFAQDLMNHPEWISDNNNQANEFGINHNRARSQTTWGNNNNNSRLKSPFKNNPFRNRRASSGDLSNGNDIDPSNPQARKAKFKDNLNSLGGAAKSRMMNLASKLQRNKEEKRTKPKSGGPPSGPSHAATYSNVLKSIDDETLIDDADDALDIDVASDINRGTYKPPKPAQAL